MNILQLKKKRQRLLKIVKVGTLEPVVTKDYVVKGLVIPRQATDSIMALLDSGLAGEYHILWKDYIGGETCFRPLESKITPTFLMNHPDAKVRMDIVDCFGNEQGFIEPELFYGFIPDWEEKL